MPASAVAATPPPPAAATSDRSGPQVTAISGILIDGLDGKVLWAKDPRRRSAIASTTKILTALIVIEKAQPSDIVTSSARAQSVGDNDPSVSELDLSAGEKLTVEQLLYGLLLPSANDAAVALAEHTGGSIEGFAELMNAKAKTLGAVDSHFTNPNGLDDPGHYSSAFDLALFARAAMRMPLFRKMVATRDRQIPWEGHPEGRALVNRNELLTGYSGANGVKTGQTNKAGKTLVGSAKRGSEERISVVLGSDRPAADSQALLEHGFRSFRRFQLAKLSQVWGQVTYGDGTSAELIALKDATALLDARSTAPKVSFNSKKLLLEADAGGLKAPVRMTCIPKPCRLPPKHDSGIFAAMMSLFAPLLSLAR
ncbi:MAG: D-alanyl-D-alanine carboxypeptidase family protein [Actinomycetota bacterium]